MSEADLITKECQNLQKTLLAKNKDYGNSFGKTFQDLGPITGLTRFLDKVNRIKNLTKQQSNGKLRKRAALLGSKFNENNDMKSFNYQWC